MKTELAKNGAYFNEFITMSDWFHTGEGLRGFFLQGLSDPYDDKLIVRMKRFAGLYMNEDPEAPNYDPEHKIIKSIWNGSKGPMLRQATVYDWVGDPAPGRFHLLHNPAHANEMLDLMKWYPRMLAHCEDYLDSAGDNWLNLAATLLHTNAYMLTGDEKYKDWVTEYVGAWKDRTRDNGGMVPSNIGLDGTLGGEHDGQWWKGTYGWNFTIFDGELQQTAHRNYWSAGTWPGFANALLLTGDQSFVDVLRKQMDNFYGHKKVENGKVLLPQMYGDPQGYKHNGEPEWYHYTGDLHTDRLTEIYLWSMDRKDLERVPVEDWIGFLEGQNQDYPRAGAWGSVRATPPPGRTDTQRPDLARNAPGRYSVELHARPDGRPDEPHAGRLLRRRPGVDAPQPFALLRSGAPPRRDSARCGSAGRKAQRGFGHRHARQRKPTGTEDGRGSGRSIRGTPVHRSRRQWENRRGGRVLDAGAPGARLWGPVGDQDEAVRQSAFASVSLGSPVADSGAFAPRIGALGRKIGLRHLTSWVNAPNLKGPKPPLLVPPDILSY